MKTEWPIRWDLLLRYRLIEIIAMWEGRLTTNHLCNTFGIGRQQASKDINNYIREHAPNNLEYDTRIKGYKPAPNFIPCFTAGSADEYLLLLHRNKELSDSIEQLDLQIANTAVIPIPNRHIQPEILRPIIQAARDNKRVEVDYVSLTKPDREGRIIVPHTLVFSGVRWHIRAYCEKNRDFRDFVLTRFRGEPELLEGEAPSIIDDTEWQTEVTIKLGPDPRLSKDQQAIIAYDYNMEDKQLHIHTKAALIKYQLQKLGVSSKHADDEPKAQQLVILNRDDIKDFLLA
jgi:predicted DNA-binding transcriptional regulator YafY|tara:strand:+ start:1230 stop:2093 length:864 start_codon:yes stop_codon:yes gene_type:complete